MIHLLDWVSLGCVKLTNLFFLYVSTRVPDFSVAEFDDQTVMLCNQVRIIPSCAILLCVLYFSYAILTILLVIFWCEKEYHAGCLRESGRCDIKVRYRVFAFI